MLVKHNYIRRLDSERGCFTQPKRKCIQTYVTVISDNSWILSSWYSEILSSCFTDFLDTPERWDIQKRSQWWAKRGHNSSLPSSTPPSDQDLSLSHIYSQVEIYFIPPSSCNHFDCAARFTCHRFWGLSSTHHSSFKLLILRTTRGFSPSCFFKIHQNLPKSLSIYPSFSSFYSAGGSKISLILCSSTHPMKVKTSFH